MSHSEQVKKINVMESKARRARIMLNDVERILQDAKQAAIDAGFGPVKRQEIVDAIEVVIKAQHVTARI